VLERFTPYRDLLKSQGSLRFKTGTLSGISARAGFIEAAEGGSDPYRFVIFLRRGGGDIDVMMRCLSECFNGGSKDER
jgi:D-alanyl-D-alanine carboxypeptidase/D-alanyl-D-alanine-endopeptidase (penicillin-binding protein 4)